MLGTMRSKRGGGCSFVFPQRLAPPSVSPSLMVSMRIARILLLAVSQGALVPAAVVGTNPPTLPLSAERIAALPVDQHPAWRAYLARSETARRADEKFYAAELSRLGLAEPIVPPRGRGVSLTQPVAWHASAEGRRVADHLISFQTPAGGWNKNTDFAAHARQPGERSGFEHGYVGTIDNDATHVPLQFLAKTVSALSADSAAAAPYRAAFNRGVEYLLAAEFPNGGWPQVWPLEGGYHDMITFNDGAITNVLTFMNDLAAGRDAFAFAPTELRARARASVLRGISCILATQVLVEGRRTAWCQQHDPLTLAPTSARNYEMPSLSSGESAGLVLWLMQLPNPSPAIVTAVHGAAAWFQQTIMRDIIFKPASDGSGRAVIPTPGAGPIWPRYSEIGSNRPLFGDRDRTIHDDVSGISKERRNGYAWFSDTPKRALAHYEKWAKLHPAAK
jgi:PelA/Pel-15E family pectate lyase